MNKDCNHIIGIADGKLTTRFEYVRGMYTGAFTDFAYCPKCGAKIGWNSIGMAIGTLEKIRAAKRINNIRDIIGKWPGDETDVEFDELMREHEERD